MNVQEVAHPDFVTHVIAYLRRREEANRHATEYAMGIRINAPSRFMRLMGDVDAAQASAALLNAMTERQLGLIRVQQGKAARLKEAIQEAETLDEKRELLGDLIEVQEKIEVLVQALEDVAEYS